LHPEYLGSHTLELTQNVPELPILIKLIDAKSDLSVQVHPDDEYARVHENGSWGKTEMWYLLDARPDAELVYGFKRDVNAEQVRVSVENGSIAGMLNRVKVHKNDLFFIEPGTVHAIGAGCLIAEIQQSSNLTYRLYDYDRVGKDGNKRELHIDKAIDVMNMHSSSVPRQPMRVLKYNQGCASELLTRCRYFMVERLLLNTEGRRLAEFKTNSNSFHALLIVDGCGNISSAGGDFNLNFFKGDCIFVPADSVELRLHGRAQILNVSC
jgi:mannose-6-phosphate isomerase